MNVVVFDLLWLILYLFAIILISFYTSKEKFTFIGYTIGNRRYSNSTMAATIAATLLGGNSILGVTESICELGAIFVLVCFGDVISKIFIAKIIAPKITEHTYAVTMGDIMYRYYGYYGRVITGLLATLYSAAILAIQISALAYVVQYLVGINYTYGVLISSTIIILYATIGGIKSVTYTDVLQFILLITIIPIIATSALNNIKVDEITALLYQNSEQFNFIPLFLLFCLPTIKPSIVQRFLMSKNSKQASNTMFISALMHIPFYFFVLLIAIAAKYYFPHESSKLMFFHLIDYTFPTGLKGIVTIALLSIIMSTADSELNVASTTFVKDFIAPIFHPKIRDPQKVVLAKICTILIGITAILIAINIDNMMQIAIAAKYIWTPIILIPFLGAIFGYTLTNRTFFVMIFIFASNIIIYFLLDLKYYSGFDAVFPCAIINSICFLIMYAVANNFKPYSLIPRLLTTIGAVIRILHTSCTSTLKKCTNFHFLLTENNFIRDVKHDIFAAFILINYSMPYFLWFSDFSLRKSPIIELRMIAMVLSGLIFIREYLPSFLKKFYPTFWFCILVYDLVFLPSQMLIATEFNTFSVIWFFGNAVLLSVLTEIWEFIILTICGLCLGFIFMLASKTFQLNIDLLKLIGFSYIFILALTIAFYKRKEKLDKQHIEAMTLMGGIIAHEMRTPLAAIKANVYSLRNIFSNNTNINEYNLRTENILNRIDLIIDKAKNYVDLTLVNLKKQPELNLKICSVKDLILIALNEYPMSNSEKKTIKYCPENNEDFHILGDELMIKYVLFNLLQNSLTQINSKEAGNIMITLGERQICLEDNVGNLKPEMQEKIFEFGVSHAKNGTGFGLAFCKLIIESLGGQIWCEASSGQYVKFVINFPEVINGCNS